MAKVNGALLLFTLSLIVDLSSISCQVHYITPTQSNNCSTSSCLTLSQFTANYIDASNTTLVIVGGSHDLNRSISVSNAVAFSMLSANFNNTDSNPVIITCSEHASFTFRNVSSIRISGLMFVGCGNNRIELVDQLIVNHSMFRGQDGCKTSLTIVSTNTTRMIATSFVSNTMGTLLSTLRLPPVINSPTSLSASTTIGGALIVSNSDITFDNCLFEDNEANIGGAIYSELESNIMIQNSTFISNHAKGCSNDLCYGGALFINGLSTVSILHSTFTNNTSDKQGGMAAIFNASLLVSHSNILNNTAVGYGGALAINQCSMLMICSSNLYNNSAGYGGVISTYKPENSVQVIFVSDIFINDSHFDSNSAANYGGVFHIDFFTTTEVYRSKFKNNRAPYNGGVFTITRQSKVVANESEFENNTAQVGGVIYAQNGTDTKIHNCNFTKNSAENGGVYYVRENSTLTIGNGRFINNAATEDGGIFYTLMQSVLTISNSDFRGNSAVGNGGAVFIKERSNATFYCTMFFNNTATSGGVIFATNDADIVIRQDSTVSSTNCSYFDHNHADSDGGVIFLKENSSILISMGSFYSNTAKNNGGVVRAQRQTLVTIESSNFNSNTVSRYGGVVHLEESNITIYGSSFDDNHADIDGGVIEAYTLTNVNIHGSNFSNNSASADGGVSHISGDSTIAMKLSQFSNNNARVDAGVLYAEEGHSITVYLCEFNENTAENRGGVLCAQKENLIAIESCSFYSNKVSRYGGVVHLEESNMMVTNGIFNDNYAGINGGVIDSFTMTNISIHNSTFSNNSASVSGGVTSISVDSIITMNHNHFSNNSAGVNAGVLYAVEGTNTTIHLCTFNGNSADYGGVLLTLRKNVVMIYHSTFNNNTAKTDGGVLYGHTMCSFSIFNGSFVNNTALSDGIMLASDTSSIEIDNSILRDNTAGNIGGIAYVYDYSHMIVNNSTFSSNRAEAGGIVYGRKNSNITFNNSTIINNLAQNSGGGVYIQQDSNVTIAASSNFSDNTADYGGVVCINVRCRANIMNSSFSGNRGNVEGGVIAAYKNSITRIQISVFTSNTAIYGGVAHAFNNSYLLFEGNMYMNNSADFGGVARLFQNVTALFMGDTFEYNSGLDGGVLYTKNAKTTFENCNISNSYAGYRGGVIYAESQGVISIIISTVSNNTAKDDGGAIAVYNGSDVSVTGSKFISNNAIKNGGVIDVQQQSNISVTNSTFRFSIAGDDGGVIRARYGSIIDITWCTFTENFAGRNGGAIAVSLNSSFSVATTFFMNNSAQSGGAIYLKNSLTNTIIEATFQLNIAKDIGGAIVASESSEMKIIQCNFTQNMANVGAALATIQNSTITVTSLNPINITDLQAVTKTQIQYNEAEYGGGVYLSVSDLYFDTTTTFIENRVKSSGGGVYAVNSSITITSTVTFNRNQAKSGGGIGLANSKLHVNGQEGIKAHINFILNYAINYGGGMYVEDEKEDNVCSNNPYDTGASNQTECFFESGNDSLIINFINNNANIAGSNLYGGLLDRCILASNKNHPSSKLIAIGSTRFIEISNITDIDSISSEPVRVCYCYNSEPDCNQQKPNIKIVKGDELTFSIAAVNQVNQPVNATIRSSFRNLVLSNSQTIRAIGAECSTLHYQVTFPREATKYELNLYAEGPCNNKGISQLSVIVEVLKCVCGPGFVAVSNTNICTCDCDNDEEFMKYIKTCNYSMKTVVREGTFWIELFNDTEGDSTYKYFIYPYCPLDYCQPPSKEVQVNLNLPNGSDAQCANNRGDLLCGRCLSNHCLSLGSSKCLSFPNRWQEQAAGIVISALLAGIILVILILVLNLTVAIGTLNSTIFYANIINANKSIYFDQSSVVFAPVSVLISWLNLDIGIDVCFFEEMDTYAKTWLQLAFPIYIMFLVVLIIWISSCSTKFSNLLGKRNPVATLATLILLSYTKLLQTIIIAFSLVILTYPDKQKSWLWLPDPTIEYGKGKHIALIFVAVFILLLGMFYTLLLLSWQCLLHSPKSRFLKWTRNHKLHSFIDAYHIPHNAKHRYWTGLLLFIRIIVYLISAFTTSIDPRITLLATALIMCCLFLYKNLLIIRVYKNRLLNSMESFAYFNIAMLTLFTWYTFDNQRKQDLQKVVAHLSVGATLIQLVLVFIFHSYRYSNTNIYIHVSEKIKRSKLINMLRSHTQGSDYLLTDSVNLLDAIDSPRIKYAPQILKGQEEPTCSSVSLTKCDEEEKLKDNNNKITFSKDKPQVQSFIAKRNPLAKREFHSTRKSESKVFTFPSQEINENMKKPLLKDEEISEL